MKFLKQILFTIVAIIGLSVAVSAQKGDQKPTPPKDPPPKVVPGGPKKPPPPKEDKPKKPGMVWFPAVRANDEFA